MIRVKTQTADGQDILIMGLNDADMEKLKSGKILIFDASNLGLEKTKITLFAAASDAAAHSILYGSVTDTIEKHHD